MLCYNMTDRDGLTVHFTANLKAAGKEKEGVSFASSLHLLAGLGYDMALNSLLSLDADPSCKVGYKLSLSHSQACTCTFEPQMANS